MASGLQEFKQVLTDFRELGSLAVKGTVAAPLVDIFLKFGPPPATAIAVLTSGMQFLAVTWTFHFWHDTPEQKLNRRMKVCAALFVVGLIFAGAVIKQYTASPGPGRERVVLGYELRSDVKPLIGPNYSALDALREAQYDTSQVWTDSSITVIHVFLVTCWTGTFVAVAMFISTFLMLQRARREAAAVRTGSQGV